METDPEPGSKRKKQKKLPLGVVLKDGRWYVRVRYREAGQRHAVWSECAKNATSAREVREQLLADLKQHGPTVMRNSRKTFGELADYYRDNYLTEALYVDGKKFSGRRITNNPKYALEQLRAEIGAQTRLRSVDFEFVRLLRVRMLKTPVIISQWIPDIKEVRGQPKLVKRGKKVDFSRPRSMTDVNRKLELLRHMLNVGRRMGWLLVNPFADAPEPLITRADEKKRRRIMSFEEEQTLLAQCVEPREHLRLVIIGLVDTLMRATEFFKLRVSDLDFDPRKVTVQQMNAKTLCERSAPISARFARELKTWCESQNLKADDRLFAFSGVKRSWSTAKRTADVKDLRIKDLRRRGATRLLHGGMPVEEISRILGHTTISMQIIICPPDLKLSVVERSAATNAAGARPA